MSGQQEKVSLHFHKHHLSLAFILQIKLHSLLVGTYEACARNEDTQLSSYAP